MTLVETHRAYTAKFSIDSRAVSISAGFSGGLTLDYPIFVSSPTIAKVEADREHARLIEKWGSGNVTYVHLVDDEREKERLQKILDGGPATSPTDLKGRITGEFPLGGC